MSPHLAALPPMTMIRIRRPPHLLRHCRFHPRRGRPRGNRACRGSSISTGATTAGSEQQGKSKCRRYSGQRDRKATAVGDAERASELNRFTGLGAYELANVTMPCNFLARRSGVCQSKLGRRRPSGLADRNRPVPQHRNRPAARPSSARPITLRTLHAHSFRF